MREFNHIIRKSLVNGLRPSSRISRDRPFLKEAFNVKITEYGMEEFIPVQDPFNGAYSVNFPFPQLYVGEGSTLLMDKRNIYRVDMSTNPWTANVLTIKDGRNPSASGSITEGGDWHIADMNEHWFLFNGKSVVFKTNHKKLTGKKNQIFVINDVSVNTGTSHRGRNIIGGFDPNNIWGDSWKFFFRSWEESISMEVPFEFDDIGSNYVMWSSIGGGDFPLWLFYPRFAMEGFVSDAGYYGIEPQASMLIEKLRRNEWGFMPMPWQGEVLKILPLGNNIIVYGEEAVTALIPTSSSNPDVAPTYGVRHLMNIGIADRGAVGGNDGGHLLVDESGELWTISPDLQTQKIGYKEYFEPMLGKDIIVSFNQQESEFYISDKSNCYVLDRGLSRIKQRVTSVEFEQGGLIGLFTEENDDSVEIVTNPITLNARATKTITVITADIRSPHSTEVAVEYKTNKRGSFTRTRFVPLNKEGVAEFRVSGLSFRIVIKTNDYPEFDLNQIEVRYQPDDKRHIRGTHANPTNT